MKEPTAVVMAAGKGTRMKSELPKVLVPIHGRPMVEYVLDALKKAGVNRILLVVGYRSDLVRQTLGDWKNLTFVEQTEQLGTGHAVMVCREELQDHQGPTMVLAGDCPMIQIPSIEALFDHYRKDQASCILGTAYKDDPSGLGRILRDDDNQFVGIVEEKDATEEQKAINEVNMSYYVFHNPDLLEALDHLKTDNAQGEYYITDAPAVLRDMNKSVVALPVLKSIESLGINTMDELKVVEEALENLDA
jgi:bifunctional UDP-N-acetylglucosamine pyrophosphorylase/glucosamine-1-phosphate N-acetyltransferase/UDP-N-acetylglucosamine pyrophosphorylase